MAIDPTQIELTPEQKCRLAALAEQSGMPYSELVDRWLDQSDSERAAIQEGIDAWRRGDVQELSDFDRQFRAKNGIPTDA